ncbi:flp pilus assembly protein CpaB [Sporosarcina oncorhynchi]|uniref:Flp pilus assembly protein CpaB n=1 Tax=Sporosarcina oncorhynchi TaxID=3056444 RepID=A0ABZ0L7U6_9BACL|nr:flp pilus assembly protein CpaB [Sporosarcina sp. T2O-4]WOV88244.1 flp pilus assembly protein CpaB [Sporosarcina sp. T2O-4]
MLEAKRRAAIFLVLAFILAAVTGYLVLEKVKELNAELGGMTSIYIAKGSIPSRSQIELSQVTKMDIPNKFVTDSHIVSEKDFEHQVSIVPLNPGDIITKNMIKPISNLQDANNRLVTMYRTDKVQFDQVLTALDRVDIIVSTSNDGKKKTKVFMKDVLVAFAQGTNDNFSGIAVEVTAEEAPNLIHMQHYADHIRILKANVGQASSFGDQLDTEQMDENSTVKEPEEKSEPELESEVTTEKGKEKNEAETEEESSEETTDATDK